jgi:hypothetical protein
VGLELQFRFCHIFGGLAGDGQRMQSAAPPPSSRRSTMKKIVYSLAVMLRVARADKLSVPYRYY